MSPTRSPARAGAILLSAVAGLALALLCAVPDASAHSRKETTVPADGAALRAPPEVIVMEFDTPIRITSLSLTTGAGDAVELRRTTGPRPVTRYEAVPPALGAGSYRVEWRGLSEDGHTMQGSFSFEVE